MSDETKPNAETQPAPAAAESAASRAAKRRAKRDALKAEAKAAGGPERLPITPATANMIAGWIAQRDMFNARIQETIGVLIAERGLEGEIGVGRLVSENGTHYFEIQRGARPAATGPKLAE